MTGGGYSCCWFIMGMPLPSHPCGVFHGRTEAFSGSLVSQPLTAASTPPSKRSSSHLAARRFMSGSRMRGADFVAFNHLAEFPARHNIGNAAVLFDAADDDFGNEFAFAAHQQFAIFNHTLGFTDVQHDKI